MDESRAVPAFRCDRIETSKLAREWKVWKESLECFFAAYDITDQRVMRAKMLHMGGSALQTVFKNLEDHDHVPLVSLVPRWYDVAVEKLDAFFEPRHQNTSERRKLRQIKQNSGERFTDYVIRLKQQVGECGFERYGADIEEILKNIYLTDAVVEGCSSNEVRRMILLKDLPFKDIEAFGVTQEGVDQQLVEITQSGTHTMDKVYSAHSQNRDRRSAVRDNSNRVSMKKCYNCGRQGHLSTSPMCPARGQQCRNCKNYGHFEKLCRKRKSTRSEPSQKNQIRVIESISNDNDLNVVVPEDNPTQDKVYYAFYSGNESNMLTCSIGGVSTEMLVDSGADANLISEVSWVKMKNSRISVYSSTRGSSRILRAYGSDIPLTILGTFVADITIGEKTIQAEFLVVKGGQRCLLGDRTAKQLGVLKIGLHVNRVENSTQPFSKIRGITAYIPMNPEAIPVFQPMRRIPLPLEQAVAKKIDELLKRDIIEIKTGPTCWVSPLVIVGKANGEPRLCVDLRRVNEAVLREHHPMPVVEDYIARLGRGLIWSKLDIREAFLQVELAEESRDVTTFMTNRGLFRFKRLPFGLVTAPELFQKAMDEILADCSGTYWYLDDIIVEGKDIEEHDNRLEKVLSRLKDRGVELKWEKCQFWVTELEFLGHQISRNGISPSESKVAALMSFREPENEAEVRSFLGLANYLNRFIPHLATIDEPLRKLLVKGTKFEWTSRESESFQSIKMALSNVSNLGFYKVEDRTAVVADASPQGLGAILLQINDENVQRVISFASKSLTETERRYCQTEKEALAVVWSVERFQYYLLGRKFNILTDSIQEPKPFDQSEEIFVREVAIQAANCAALTWNEIVQATEIDDEISKVLEILRNGDMQNLSVEYRVVANELCNFQGVLLRNDRIVVPFSLREKVLITAHQGHPGIVMMKSHLRSNVWWPKMDQAVERFVKRCRGCVLVAAPEAPEPMQRSHLPSSPWQTLALDFLGPLPEGQHVLVVVDCYSRYIEVVEMDTTTTKDVTRELMTMFSRYGIPSFLKADNAPQISSDCEEFNEFCSTNGIKLLNTIPYWPQSNGEVERQNRSILKRLRISQELGKDWRNELRLYLLTYHSSKHPTTGKSPAELMFGRQIKSKLPTISTFS
ncbi:uncharacterized protein K02A2.6-like [Toxorhynchites rutilus septentrionalis]|uniref:uncharacterized protein K02A2.6-like n=1 Tax=Toxorhynchites rutilus septentrionalis TaxID=329112 RepID=UPI002479A987|nr:uncharacterized protein K02A2.6-like [Toxorhynchites rutilus septentrionalis]